MERSLPFDATVKLGTHYSCPLAVFTRPVNTGVKKWAVDSRHGRHFGRGYGPSIRVYRALIALPVEH